MTQLALLQSAMSSFGTLMVGYAAIKIHFRIMHEHAIDTAVEEEMKREQKIAIGGVILIIFGFLIDVYLLSIF
jgi:UPF0716 family protein affecting phage T7 exclusion